MLKVSVRTLGLAGAIFLGVFSALGATQRNTDEPTIKTANIGRGIVLHYTEKGSGTPVIFVHGSLSDGGYWADQIGPFGTHYRAIAYSRR